MSPIDCRNRLGTGERIPDGKSDVLEPPEGLVGFSKRLFLRDADVLQEVKVVALGNFA
jgi:hypothetical protein